MLEKMMFFRQKTKKIGTCHGFPAVTCAGLSKKSDFFDSPCISRNAQIQIFGVLSLILAVSAEKAGTVRLPSKETVERDRQTFSGSS